jgi:rubrerythrin
MDWQLVLKSMIGDEQAAQARYDHAAQQADSHELKAMFEQLHDEEVVHQRILEGWLDRLSKSKN